MEHVIALLDELGSKVPQIEHLSDANLLHDIDAGIQITQEYISRLKQLKPAAFDEPEREVFFYKQIGPAFNSYLIFYVCLLPLATGSLIPYDTAKKTYAKELRRIERYYERTEKMRRYFLLKESSLDHQLFTQASFFSSSTLYEDACFADRDICTPAGLTFSRFMAYEKLQALLDRTLREIKEGKAAVSPAATFEVQWTDKKVHLQELIYALAYSHSINNGNIDVKTLARVFENLFKLDLSNIYRAKQDMYTRRNVSAYLDFLKQRFKEGVDEADDRNNYRRSF